MRDRNGFVSTLHGSSERGMTTQDDAARRRHFDRGAIF
jgi:hypothetical protein